MATIGEMLQSRNLETAKAKAQRAKTTRVEIAAALDLKRDELTVLTVIVTPAIAAQWLEYNEPHNRSVKERAVSRFSRDMKDGNWMTNGDPIRFTRNGTLIDGQHRLLACVKAGAAFETLVALGLESKVIETIDCGVLRRAGDVIAMERPDLDNPHKVGAVINYIWRYENGHLFSNQAPTSHERHECLNKHPGVVDSIAATQSMHLASSVLLAFCHYLFSTLDSTMAEVFFSALETGTNLHGNEPVFLLRERLTQNRASRAKLNQLEQLALVFKAWNLTRAGAKVKALRWNLNSGEDFPHVEGHVEGRKK